MSTLEPGAPAGSPPVGIDPRIRARRLEVQRDEGRRRLQRILEATALTVVALGFLGALRTPMLDVDHVTVAGTGRTPAADIEAAARVAPGTQLIDVDVREVAEGVAALPWVDEATVSRGVDGRVEISVTERAPISQVRTEDGEVLLVDRDGRALGPPSDAPDASGALVTVIGLVDDLAPGEHLPRSAEPVLRVADALAQQVPGVVAELAIGTTDAGREISGRLASGGAVRFGDASQLDAKLLSLLTVLEQVDTEGLAVLDLRLPGNPVLTRESG